MTYLSLLIIIPSVTAQKSYITPAGQFIKIKNENGWDYIEEPPLISNTNIIGTDLSEYNTLLKEIYSKEADFYSKYIIYKFQLDQKETLSEQNRTIEKNLIEKYKKAGSLISSMLELPQMDDAKRASAFQNIKIVFSDQFLRSINNNSASFEDVPAQEPIPELTDQKQPITKSPELKEKDIFKEDTIIKKTESNPSQSLENYLFEKDNRTPSEIIKITNCNLLFDGFDETLNSYRKETKLQKFFDYSHPKLIRHFKENSFLIGKASMLKANNKYYLNLELTIKSKDARRSYGFIDKSAMLRITLLSGKQLFLNNRILSEGKLESYTGNTVYRCFYEMNNDDVHDLENLEIDKVGIMWTTGFEEYPIYKIDFFQHQIHCLKHENQN